MRRRGRKIHRKQLILLFILLTIHQNTVYADIRALQTTSVPEDEYEPDNDFFQRTQIGLNETQLHTLHEADKDMYNLTISRYLMITISIQTTAEIRIYGTSNLSGIGKIISPPEDEFVFYTDPIGENFFDVFSNVLVESYNITVFGEILEDPNNHEATGSQRIDLDQLNTGYLNVTDTWGINWYNFTLTKSDNIRILFNFPQSEDLLFSVLYYENLTQVGTSYYHSFEREGKITLLKKLDPGNYYLSISSNTAVFQYSRPFFYNFTLNTNISNNLYTEKIQQGDHLVYSTYGTIIDNSSIEIKHDELEFGAFVVDFQSQPFENTNYSLLNQNLKYNPENGYYFTTLNQLLINVTSTTEPIDFHLILTQELGDRYEYRESEDNPTELLENQLHRYTNLNLHHPDDVDHFSFTPINNGTLYLTVRCTSDVNITVYDNDGIMDVFVIDDTYDSSLKMIEIELEVRNVSNSGIKIEISLDDPSDLFSSYTILLIHEPNPWSNTITPTPNNGNNGDSSFIGFPFNFLWIIPIIIIARKKRISNN